MLFTALNIALLQRYSHCMLGWMVLKMGIYNYSSQKTVIVVFNWSPPHNFMQKEVFF